MTVELCNCLYFNLSQDLLGDKLHDDIDSELLIARVNSVATISSLALAS